MNKRNNKYLSWRRKRVKLMDGYSAFLVLSNSIFSLMFSIPSFLLSRYSIPYLSLTIFLLDWNPCFGKESLTERSINWTRESWNGRKEPRCPELLYLQILQYTLDLQEKSVCLDVVKTLLLNYNESELGIQIEWFLSLLSPISFSLTSPYINFLFIAGGWSLK